MNIGFFLRDFNLFNKRGFLSSWEEDLLILTPSPLIFSAPCYSNLFALHFLFVYLFHGRSQDFSKGGHTVSNRGYSRFRNLNIVGCLLKNRLKRGGHGHPRTPLATPLYLFFSPISKIETHSIVR